MGGEGANRQVPASGVEKTIYIFFKFESRPGRGLWVCLFRDHYSKAHTLLGNDSEVKGWRARQSLRRAGEPDPTDGWVRVGSTGLAKRSWLRGGVPVTAFRPPFSLIPQRVTRCPRDPALQRPGSAW